MSTMNNALNRAFEKAFAYTASRDTLLDLLRCLGEELGCGRISVFELNHNETCDNTHEWCAENVLPEQEMLQSVPLSSFGSWPERMKRDECVWIRDLKEIREKDAPLFEFFESQQVHSVVLSRLAFHGKTLGFFVLENPNEAMFDDTEVILPGMRYILSSLVYADQLVRRLRHVGYTDRLTGAGNRQGLQEFIDRMNPAASLGVISCEVIGWIEADSRPLHLQPEMMFVQAGNVLTEFFGEKNVFRVSRDEFLVLQPEERENAFRSGADFLGRLFREHDLQVAMATLYRKSCGDSEEAIESMIRQAHLLTMNERKRMEEETSQPENAAPETGWGEEQTRARILLPRGDAFFRRADQFLSQIFDQPILTAVIDVNYFKLYNDIFGRRAGSLLLEEIAASLEMEAEKQGGVAGYLGGDNFCLMVPAPMTETEKLKSFIEGIFADLKYADGFAPVMGIYISYDRLEMMVTMYDRALTALGEIKGSYMEHYRFYDAEHFRHQKEDKILLMDVKEALPRNEFIFYIQPQVNDRTGRIIGGEALVRWQRGQEVVPPSRFVPVLEKTGYIFAVDCVVWESVVKWLRSLIDRGIQPVPVSVNVSRVDFYFTDIAEHFIRLLEKYDVPASLLGIEITESAFTDNMDSILEAVDRLHTAGFRLLMDDFGSGSSSLSMLHTMQLDVLKTDVRFMSRKSADAKAVSIVEAVVSMAHMIGMMVVTEGVETEEQRENLIAIGDNYAQGFYFYHPMPKESFEMLLCRPEIVGQPPRREDQLQSSHLALRSMIREGMVSDVLLDNIIGPAAIFRKERGEFQLLQMNEQFGALTGTPQEHAESVRRLERQFSDGAEGNLRDVIRAADQHPLDGAKGWMEIRREDGGPVMAEVRVFLLYSCENHRLYLTTLSDKKGIAGERA